MDGLTEAETEEAVEDLLQSLPSVPVFQLDRQSMIGMLNTLLTESQGLTAQMREIEVRLFARTTLDALAANPKELVKLYTAVAKRRNDGLTHIMKICEMGMKSDIARTFLGLFKVDEELRGGTPREATPEMTPRVRQLMHRLATATNQQSGVHDAQAQPVEEPTGGGA